MIYLYQIFVLRANFNSCASAAKNLEMFKALKL